MQRSAVVFLTAFILLTGYAVAAQRDPPCKGNPKVVDACFDIRGRLGIYNGIPIRIWVIGTHHMLSVSNLVNNGGEELPPAVQTLLDPAPFDTVVFGNYEVCPLEKFHAGWMQGVCIERATNLVARPWAETGAK